MSKKTKKNAEASASVCLILATALIVCMSLTVSFLLHSKAYISNASLLIWVTGVSCLFKICIFKAILSLLFKDITENISYI